jgi:hypothetical protein
MNPKSEFISTDGHPTQYPFPSHLVRLCDAHALFQLQYDEDILVQDIPDRTRPRSADTAIGGSGNESDEAVCSSVVGPLKYNMMALPADARNLHPCAPCSLRLIMLSVLV